LPGIFRIVPAIKDLFSEILFAAQSSDIEILNRFEIRYSVSLFLTLYVWHVFLLIAFVQRVDGRGSDFLLPVLLKPMFALTKKTIVKIKKTDIFNTGFTLPA